MIILFDPDDEESKAFAGAYYDDSQELSFLGKKLLREMTEDEEEIKAAGDEAYDDLISYERLTGTM